MGRVSLPRVQGRRRGRAAGQVGQAARPLFSGDRRDAAQLPAPQFVVDGEIVIELDGALSFDALQMRLHPAESRIRKLSRETPAQLMLFDMLADAGRRKS